MKTIGFDEPAVGADPLKTLIPAISYDNIDLPEVPYITQLMEGRLYMGGVHPDMELPAVVKYVVSMHPVSYRGSFDRGRVSVRYYNVHDDDFQDPTIFSMAADLVSAFMDKNDGGVLVHCQAGLNRSGAVAALTLMKRLYWSPDRAIGYLRRRRSPVVLYNKHFEKYVWGLR